MQHVDHYGIGKARMDIPVFNFIEFLKVCEMTLDHLKDRTLHLSFDIDSCDPGLFTTFLLPFSFLQQLPHQPVRPFAVDLHFVRLILYARRSPTQVCYKCRCRPLLSHR